MEFLNLRCLTPQLPDEFEGYYDGEKYAQSQRYTRDRTKLGLINSAFNTVVLITFILIGVFNFVDQVSRSIGWTEIPTGLVFFGILMLGMKLINLPFSVYGTFVIEERYGFNRTTLKTFALDFLKKLLITIILGGGVLALIIWFFLRFGEGAWLYIWAFLTLFQLFMIYIHPTLLMPIFNKFKPLEDGELKDSIEEYTHRHKFRMKGIYTIDGSKRSTKSNAFFAGFGRLRRIGLYDTLIEKHTIKELLGILAHEVGHYKLGHIIPKGLIINILNTGLVLFILSFFINNRGLFEAFRMEELSVYASLYFFSFLYSPIAMTIGLVLKAVSRRHEYQADAFAVKTTNDAKSFAAALKKMSVHNLANLTPHPLKVFLEYSHPPVIERIRALQNTADPRADTD